MREFWNRYPEMDKELKSVVNIIEKNAKCRDKVVEKSILELLYSGGKMLRPSFVILASKFGQYDKEKARSLAAVVEMFHMATLVHDDIIDEATLRRGKETVQSKYGKNYAVYIGDYLFCICFFFTQRGFLKLVLKIRDLGIIILTQIRQIVNTFI